MFAGKSSAILQRIRRADILGWKHLIITCIIDTRYSGDNSEISKVTTHDQVSTDALGVSVLKEVDITSDVYLGARMIIIEESQFFPDLYDFVLAAVERDGKDVVVVGLDGDSDRRPFGQVLRLIPMADDIQHLSALCKRCGDGTAGRFSALVRGVKLEQIHVGGADSYEPMCRKHYLDNSSQANH